jgi:hypothetical protein
MVERLHAIAIADASQRWGSHITRVNGLFALQAQDIVDEVIGLLAGGHLAARIVVRCRAAAVGRRPAAALADDVVWPTSFRR